jgi:hypothetical protein
VGGFPIGASSAIFDGFYSLPFFGKEINIRTSASGGTDADTIVKIDGALLTAANFPDVTVVPLTGSFNLSTGVWSQTGSPMGTGLIISGLSNANHVIECSATLAVGVYFFLEALDIYPGIHRSNHYSKLTYNPYVSPELVGGGDGICNDNLIVSPDGKILEDLRRPDAVELPDVDWCIAKDSGNVTADGNVKYNLVRGARYGVRNCIYVPATGEIIVLKDKKIVAFMCHYAVGSTSEGAATVTLQKNGGALISANTIKSSTAVAYGAAIMGVDEFLFKKNDLISVYANAGLGIAGTAPLNCHLSGSSVKDKSITHSKK